MISRTLIRLSAFFVALALFSIWWMFNTGPYRDPEDALKDFYAAKDQDRVEDQLTDPLILVGESVVPLILKELPNKEMRYRRYAISFLGNGRYKQALSSLEKILSDASENDYFRSDALRAIYLISDIRAKALAPVYIDRRDSLGKTAKDIALGKFPICYSRSYWEAFWHVHY